MNESALSVCLDVLRLPNEQWSTMLTLGSNSKVIVLERDASSDDAATPSTFTEVERITTGVSDNVSCVRTVFLSETKQVVTLYGTYDGRLSAKAVK